MEATKGELRYSEGPLDCTSPVEDVGCYFNVTRSVIFWFLKIDHSQIVHILSYTQSSQCLRKIFKQQ